MPIKDNMNILKAGLCVNAKNAQMPARAKAVGAADAA